MIDETQPLRIVGGILVHDGARRPLTIVAGRITDRLDEGKTGTTVDADGLTLCPGFVDLQINGGFGLDVTGAPETMWKLGRLLPRHGVTSYLPTIVSSPAAVTDRALTAFARRPSGHRGAEPLGLHFEGPMLNHERAGAHEPGNLVAPDPKIVARWTRANGVVLVTIAPELPGAAGLIAGLRTEDVFVSAGHSLATATEATVGFDAGVTMVTHLFNAMGPMSHRAPGLAGAALADDRVAVGLIVDGVHVDPTMVKLAWRAKGPSLVVLVTDAVAAMGLDPGRYELGGRAVTADLTSVRTDGGVLAGSVLTMDQAVRNLVEFTGCSLRDAVTAASAAPAAAIGATDRGHLQPGAVADVVLLESDGAVAVTICGGVVAHVTESAAGRVTDRKGTLLWRS